MINRVGVNWKLMLAIAELAGGPWLEQARAAAQRLSRSGRQPSDGVRLLAAIRVMFIESGKTELTSEEMVAELCSNPLDIWASYNKGGRITHFDPFCPKALGLIAGNLPRTLKTRSITIQTVPKRADELVEPFEHVDDFELAALRRQLARFAADNAAVLKTAQHACRSPPQIRYTALHLQGCRGRISDGIWD